MMYIVIAGSPINGYEFWGPFPDHDTAITWVESEITGDGDWWIDRLEEPTT